MAGIEKVCDYEGGLMYSQKYNSIQVLNKHKKHFRYANHELIIVPNSKILKHKRGYALVKTPLAKIHTQGFILIFLSSCRDR